MQGFSNFLGLFQVIMANPGFDMFTKEPFDRLTGGTAETPNHILLGPAVQL